jgi:hypothetical protein
VREGIQPLNQATLSSRFTLVKVLHHVENIPSEGLEGREGEKEREHIDMLKGYFVNILLTSMVDRSGT